MRAVGHDPTIQHAIEGTPIGCDWMLRRWVCVLKAWTFGAKSFLEMVSYTMKMRQDTMMQ